MRRESKNIQISYRRRPELIEVTAITQWMTIIRWQAVDMFEVSTLPVGGVPVQSYCHRQRDSSDRERDYHKKRDLFVHNPSRKYPAGLA